MPDERTQAVLEQCEQKGLAWAKVFIARQEISDSGLDDVRYWIAEREQKVVEDRERTLRHLYEASIGEARDAASASRRSAHWTMIAGLAAAASAGISATMCVAVSAGWLSK